MTRSFSLGQEVLETYARPYNPERPVICMDE
jgi:hypothetical protein